MSFKALAVTSSLLAATIASADIGFPAAVDASRAAAPQGNLFAIQKRIRSGVMVYESELYDAPLSNSYGPRLSLSGAILRLDQGHVNDATRATLQPVADRLGELQIGFADAINAANADTSRTDVQKVSLEIEANILAYHVDYFDGVSRADIDGATGGVIPHHLPGDDMDPTNPSTAVVAAVGVAQAEKGKGWVSIGLESEAEAGGNTVEVLLLNLNSGVLSLVDVAGDTVLSDIEFPPAGGQVRKVAKIRANWSLVVTDLAGAVAVAEAAYPGAGVVNAELEAETEKTGNTVEWKLNLITADLIEIDFVVDATVPSGNGANFAMAPVNPLPGDLNLDGVVNAADITELFGVWGQVNPLIDVDGDGIVGGAELTQLIANWS